MLWAALLLSPRPDASQPCNDALHGLAVWALQFTPRVATVHEAVVMEVQASLRLLGGKRALRDRVVQEASDLGVVAIAWAPNSLAALALARAGVVSGLRRPLADVLDALPLETLSETAPHRTTLSQLGCQTLGCLRRLPRGGISRRFGKELLSAMDQAYGLRPEVHTWVTLPERFIGKLELMSRVELAPAMLFGARRLLRQLCGWLAARQAGTTAIRLSWAHDAMRSRSAGEGGALDVRTAEPTRDIEHLHRLLAEHLAKVTLAAPVGDLELQALDVQAMAVDSGCLLPESVRPGESLTLVLERLAARLGPERVLRPVLAQEHRLEWMQHWQPAPQALPRKPAATTSLPQPTFVLAEPLRLASKGDQPMYQGVLQLLSGPHRVEGGWWHRIAHADGEYTGHVQRDYWVAFSEHTGVLWIFQGRLASDETAWYLHGSFA
jgi:protein ImuB